MLRLGEGNDASAQREKVQSALHAESPLSKYSEGYNDVGEGNQQQSFLLLTMQICLLRRRGCGLDAVLYLQAGWEVYHELHPHEEHTRLQFVAFLSRQSHARYFRCRHGSFELSLTLSNASSQWCESQHSLR